MIKIVVSYYLCGKYTVDWNKVNEWFDKRIKEAFKEALKEDEVSE